MLKENLPHIVISIVIFVIGASVHDFTKIKLLGDLVAYGGLAYGVVVIIASLLGRRLPKVGKRKLVSDKSKMDELLTLKQLLDSGAISQEEYDIKASSLKSKIF